MCIDTEPLYGKARCYLRDKANELSPILCAIALYYDWPLPLPFADDRGNFIANRFRIPDHRARELS